MKSESKTYVPKSSAKLRCKDSVASDHVIGVFRNQPAGSKLILALSFKAEDLIAFAKKHANEKGYLNLCVTARREDGQYGDQFCVWLNDWKPQTREQVNQGTAREAIANPQSRGPIPEADDVPF